MEEFAQVFRKETDVGSILKERLRIRRNLRIISYRFRAFILLTLVLVAATQLASLLCIIRSRAIVNVFKAGELAKSNSVSSMCQILRLVLNFPSSLLLIMVQLSSISLVTGFFICLRSATKITHKAQSLASFAAKWHACATINSSDNLNGENPTAVIATPLQRIFRVNVDHWESEDDEEGDGDDDLDNTKMMPISEHTISFQKRQALVAYLENNRAGITMFGFMLDMVDMDMASYHIWD